MLLETIPFVTVAAVYGERFPVVRKIQNILRRNNSTNTHTHIHKSISVSGMSCVKNPSPMIEKLPLPITILNPLALELDI